jgi:PAS domain S-box-containing protein
MKRRKLTLAAMAATLLITVATLLLGTLGLLNYCAERRRGWASLESRASTKADELAAALTLPLWNFDRPQVDRVIDSAMRDPEAYAIVVRQADVSAPGGVAAYARGRDRQWHVTSAEPDPEQPGLRRQDRTIMAGDESLGSVSVYASGRLVEAELRRSLAQLVGVIVALDLLMSAAVYLILWAAVLRPVRRVQRYAAAVSTGERGEPARGRLRCRELDELQGSLETMVRLLAERYAALKQNQGMLAGILDAVPQSIFWKGRDGRYLGCNRVFADAVGLDSPSGVVGKTDFDLPWPRGEAEAYRADDRDVMESNLPKRHIIEPLQEAGGNRLWVDTTKVPLADEAGRVYGVLGVFEDVTRQREAEEWRRQQAMFDELFARALTRFATASGAAGIRQAIEEALRDVARFIGADHAYVGLFSADRRSWGTVGEWCAPGAEPFGNNRITREALPWTESTILAGDVVRVDALSEYPPEGSADLAFRRAEGARSILNVPMRGSAGLVVGGIGLHCHATERSWSDADVARLRLLGDSVATVLERQQAEEALRESEARFRAIFERAPVGIAIVDTRSGTLRQVNDEYCRIIGCAKEELAGARLQDLVDTGPLDAPGAMAGQGLAEGGAADQGDSRQRHLQAQYQRKDGKTVWIDVALAPLGGGGGGGDGPPQHLAIVEDVTARRRTQELLAEAEKLRTVAALAAGVAHEINNPLAGMVQNAQAILGRLTENLPANDRAAARQGTTFGAVRAYIEDREIPAMLDSIRDSGRQASRVVRDLLAYSRKDPGIAGAEPAEIVEQTCEIASHDLELKDALATITFERRLSDDVPPVVCRATQIQQVLLNLMRNAVQAMRANPPERPPRLVVRTIATGSYAGFEVEDNGPGIPPEQRARIFDPFFSSKRVGEGTGLGLFLCHHIVTVNHAGRIAVESRPGERTCFTVLLPAVPATGADASARAAAADQPTQGDV